MVHRVEGERAEDGGEDWWNEKGWWEDADEE